MKCAQHSVRMLSEYPDHQGDHLIGKLAKSLGSFLPRRLHVPSSDEVGREQESCGVQPSPNTDQKKNYEDGHGDDVSGEHDVPILSLIPETSAEDHFRSREGALATGSFFPIGETSPATDEGDWDLDNSITNEAQKAPRPGGIFSADEIAADKTLRFVVSGTLPSFAVRADEANALKAAIGGEAANLSRHDTVAVVRVAYELGLPVVLSGKGLLDDTHAFEELEYVVSTLGSRSSTGNFIHALVISPVLSIEEILSSKMGHAWLASIIRKEQLLVSYRPIRGASCCEDLADRAKSMPNDAESIMSRQRGLGKNSMQE